MKVILAIRSSEQRGITAWVVVLVLAGLAAVAAATSPMWWPALESARRGAGAQEREEHVPDEDAGHGHMHGGAGNPDELTLSQQARRNLGLRVGQVKLGTFERTVTIPGMVVERPGRTSVAVAAPLAGVITEIATVEGEAVSPGQKLFTVRLTHEEIVTSQGEFLKTVAGLDVTRREVRRLEQVAAEGAIPGRSFLERKYEQEKLEADLAAQREALMLHGLTGEQVDAIARDRKLLSELTVYAPGGNERSTTVAGPIWQIQDLKVNKGQHVDVGETLAMLADYRMLFIQGTAFEQDTPEIQQAIAKDWPVTAVFESAGGETERLAHLNLVYASGRVDPASRTFHFYVALPNELVRDATDAEGRRFVDWRFRPGRRVQLRVPVETWEDCLVLPVGAVAREGAESFVFQASGNVFRRLAVHERYRDQDAVVIANDGSIFPGDYVTMSGAQQLEIALRNKAGGAVDPHAGHSH